MDARQQLGELIYEVGSGIKAHSLALKIYNSEDELEYTDEEMQIIMQFVNQYCNCYHRCYECIKNRRQVI